MSKMKSADTPKNNCPVCEYQIDMASQLEGRGTPSEGQFSVCLNCGAALVFRADLTVREATVVELREAPGLLFRVQRIIQERGLLPARGKKRP